MDLSDIETSAREKLEAVRIEKAAVLLAQQESQIRLQGKYERNKSFLERKFAISDRIEGLILHFGVGEVFEKPGHQNREIEYISHCIPMQSSGDSSAELYAFAWKTVPRKGNISLIKRTVKLDTPMPGSDKTLRAGISLIAKDKESGNEVLVRGFNISGLSKDRTILATDDVYAIAGYDTDKWLVNDSYTELENVLDLIDQFQPLPLPGLSS